MTYTSLFILCLLLSTIRKILGTLRLLKIRWFLAVDNIVWPYMYEKIGNDRISPIETFYLHVNRNHLRKLCTHYMKAVRFSE